MTRFKKIFLMVLLASLSLSACGKIDTSKGYSYTKKYNNKNINVGNIKRHGFKLEFNEAAFDGKESLMIDLLSDEAVKTIEDPSFEFYLNPLELNYGENDNIRLNNGATLNVKVPKEYYGTEFDASEMFFANYYDGKWEYYLPDQFDLTDKIASIEVNHFSFWGFGKPSEEIQIDIFAKHVANELWERQNNKDKLYTLLGRLYEDLFESMGISDKNMQVELAHNMIEYLEGRIYQENTIADKTSPITNLISLAKGINEGQGTEAFTNIVSDLTGQGLFEFIKLDPGYFSTLYGLTAGLSTAAGSISEGDTEGALEGIREALHSNFMIKVSDNLLSYAKQSGEYAIEIFTATELEKAYKAYIGEGVGKYGYLEGDFNTIFTLLGGGQRQMEINIVKKYLEKYNIDEKYLSAEMKKQIVDNAYKYLEASFKERKEKTQEIEMTKEKEKAFIQLMREADFLKEYFYRDYFGMNTRNVKFDINDRLKRLYTVRDTVLNLIDPEEARLISDKELITLMEQYIKFRERNNLEAFYTQLRNTGYLKHPSKLTRGYYWKLVDRKTMVYDNTNTTKVNLSEGIASINMTCHNCEDLFDATNTWSIPNDTYYAEETISLELSSKIDQYYWIDTSAPYLHSGLNYVGTDIGAKFDKYDLDLGTGTSGAIRLLDKEGNYRAYVHTDYGEIELEYQAEKFSTTVPSGNNDGDKIGLYITNSGIGTYVYIYEWTKG